MLFLLSSSGKLIVAHPDEKPKENDKMLPTKFVVRMENYEKDSLANNTVIQLKLMKLTTYDHKKLFVNGSKFAHFLDFFTD